MEIYLVGYFVMSIGLLYFFYNPVKLYELTVFSIPFTGTAVFKIAYGGFSIEGIRASLFLGMLCLFRYALTKITQGRVKMKFGIRQSVVLLFMVVCVCMLSLIMPIIISGDLEVLDVYSDLMMYAKEKPLFFKFQYVTQVGYFVIGCLLAYFFAVTNDSPEKLERSIKIYLYASIFVACWGILELIFFYVGLPYPAFLFNQASVNHAGTIVLNGKPRITSAALEPSILSQQLITAIVFMISPLLQKREIITHSKRYIWLLIFVLVLSLSATAVAGLFCLFVWFIVTQFKKKKISKILAALIVTGMISSLVALPVLAVRLVDKLATFSGQERLKALTTGWEYFSKYPVLGIGWGVFPSWDFAICILTGMGVIGILVFVVFFLVLFLNLRLSKQVQRVSILVRATGYSFLFLLLMSQVSGFIYHSQYFWLILGLTIAASGFRSKDFEQPSTTVSQ
jgi:hypothetical protein